MAFVKSFSNLIGGQMISARLNTESNPRTGRLK